MSLKSINPTSTTAWKNLHKHFESIKDKHMTTWFEKNPSRVSGMSIKWDDFFVDFSKNRITFETLDLLKDLADEVQLSAAISKYFDGENDEKSSGNDFLSRVVDSKCFCSKS